jgi:hypothetical protein
MIILTILPLPTKGDLIYSCLTEYSNQAEIAPLILQAVCAELASVARIDAIFYDMVLTT